MKAVAPDPDFCAEGLKSAAMLLEAGADINARDGKGRSVLAICIDYTRTIRDAAKIVALLREKGAKE